MRKIEIQILSSLLESSKGFWELLDENRYTVKEFISAVNNLFRDGLIDVKGDLIYITEKGKEQIDGRLLKFKSRICSECEGKRIVFDERFKDVMKDYLKIVDDRPAPKAEFFQGYMRAQDVIARLALMHHYDDLAHKSFILVGDDDLLSIALALTGLPSRIFVLDIDERLGEYIREINRRYGLEIEFQRYDVSNPLPESLVGMFDVFSSEPLETLSGLKAFLSRGIACLKDDGAGYFGLSTAEASFRKWMAVERMLLRMNCVITDVIRDFSKYKTLYDNANYEKFTIKLSFPVKQNPGVYWYKSTLFRFEVIGRPKSLLGPEKRYPIKYIDRRDDVTSPFLYEEKRRF
ncbi:MAG: bis-aminopropyl spermidine synthase family protein [Candidatus Bathyarchaeia archaeon]|nr:bis-aminopropyl spermidine synthase family protein [Candidatus Bathyarchaeota archaeon]